MSNTQEIWKRIEGHEDYEVSNMGRVRSFKCNQDGYLLSTYKYRGGYEKLNLDGKSHTVHRLVGKAFIPNPDNKPQIHHINHLPWDNRASNLMWVTDKENKEYQCAAGRNQGETAKNQKLTRWDVYMIRWHLKEGNYTRKELAELFDVTDSNIYRIDVRKSWTHI